MPWSVWRREPERWFLEAQEESRSLKGKLRELLGTLILTGSDLSVLRRQMPPYCVCSGKLIRTSSMVRGTSSDSVRSKMATFVPGMRCAITGQLITTDSEAVVFPAFVANEADPLYVFSDAVVRADAFHAHPLAIAAQARYEEARRRTAPDKRLCLICRRLVIDASDYLGLGYLVDDRSHPLYQFNYAHFHRSHLADWKGLNQLVAELETLDRSGYWKGDALKRLIIALRPGSATS